MCGICGFTGADDRKTLERMTKAIVHRGPDDDGFYTDNHVSLGMRRLSIVDLHTGQQPIHNQSKTLWLVFNGEVYNYIELRAELEKAGHVFYTSHSDSEVILHLYEEYGDDFVHKMNGMFAFAIWDTRKRELLLVRDRMGVKPLYYAHMDGKLIFGSEIKCILEHPDYRRNPDFTGLYHYFSLKHVPSPHTCFEGIMALRPGRMLRFRNGSLKETKYWDISFTESRDLTEEHVKDELLRILDDAVRLRLRTDVPYGAYLSGGVDSSTIVGLMNRHTSQPITTFCLGYEDELQNKEADLYWARTVSEWFGTAHHEYIMSHRELVEDAEAVIRSFDQPFSGTISTYFLTKLISRHVKVAISGDAADELFGSYLTHRTARPMHHFARLYPQYKEGRLSEKEEALFAPCDTRFLEELYEASHGDEALWRSYLFVFRDDNKKEMLTENFKWHLIDDHSTAYIRKHFTDVRAMDPLNRILEVEWKTIFVDQVLAFMDFLSMAHSVEVRSPFLDYRFVTFAATIPGEMKIRDGNVKDILKRTCSSIIPEPITRRPKEGFVLPVFDWMRDNLTAYFHDLLRPERLKKHGLLDPEYVKSLVCEYRRGNRQLAAKVWNLMMFQVWWELYFE